MSIKKPTIYLYPITARGTSISLNPYVDNLITSIEHNFCVVNKNDPSNTGTLQIFKYLFNADIFYFNWIENLPDKKGGKIQVLILFFLLIIIKVLNKKIVWTMHNKISHTKQNFFYKKLIFKFLIKNSDLVLTHSSEGVRYSETLVPHSKVNISYIPHPITILPTNYETINTPKFDFLIWGAMIPYKGIHLFLEFLRLNNIENKFNILIIGKFSTTEYYEEVKKLAGIKTNVENRFANNDELHQLINNSKFVLFTYSNNSVLSSGALMDTVGFNVNIIGPNTGAFSDLSELGIIQTFNKFEDILSIYEHSETIKTNQTNRKQFIETNNWKSFGDQFANLLTR